MLELNKKSKKLRDFVKFGTAMLESGDIDPQFWIMRSYYERHNLSKNTALWHSLVYLTYYHLGSTSVAWELYPEPDHIKHGQWDPTLVFFKQRRLFRGDNQTHRAREHLNVAVKRTKGDLERWIERLVGDGGEEGWERVREAYNDLPYTGPWSSYKWCDIIKFVHKYPITAPNIGSKPGETAGPIAGLATLTGLQRETCAKDPRIYEYLYEYLKGEFGMPLLGIDHLESCLCDWQSISLGRYYHGLDLDRDLAQLLSYKTNQVSKELFEIRSEIFDHRLLGEEQDIFGGWSSVRLDLKPRYRRAGELVNIFKDVKIVELL